MKITSIDIQSLSLFHIKLINVHEFSLYYGEIH